MPGRSKDSETEAYQKRIRTRAWLNELTWVSGATSANQLALMMEEKIPFRVSFSGPKDGGTKWMNYCRKTDPRSPDENTLVQAEALVPGSKEVFENGPEGSLIYNFMWTSVDELTLQLEQRKDLKWITAQIPSGSFTRTSESDWTCLVGNFYMMFDQCDDVIFTAQRMSEDEITWWKENGDPFWWNNANRPNHLQLYAALLGSLRIGVNREKYAYNPVLPSLFEQAFYFFNEPGVYIALKRFGLDYPIAKLLHELVEEYAMLNLPKEEFSRVFCELSWASSFKNFVSRPMKYVEKIIQGRDLKVETSNLTGENYLYVNSKIGTPPKNLNVDLRSHQSSFFD